MCVLTKAILSDFLYMLIMIGMVIVGFYGTELTNRDCEHINNGTPLAFAFATVSELIYVYIKIKL